MELNSFINEAELRKLVNVASKRQLAETLWKTIDNIMKENSVTTNKEAYKGTDNYKILLKFVNKVLEASDIETVTELRDVKHVTKEVLISDKTYHIYEDMEDEIFKYFSKKDCRWYERNRIKNYMMTFLRTTLCSLGLQLISSHRNRHVKGKAMHYATYSIQ